MATLEKGDVASSAAEEKTLLDQVREDAQFYLAPSTGQKRRRKVSRKLKPAKDDLDNTSAFAEYVAKNTPLVVRGTKRWERVVFDITTAGGNIVKYDQRILPSALQGENDLPRTHRFEDSHAFVGGFRTRHHVLHDKLP
jgi:hypothetical protein